MHDAGPTLTERSTAAERKPWHTLAQYIAHFWRPKAKHARLGPGGFATVARETRQQKRAAAFRASWRRVCERYGGGLHWVGACEPRRARRRIARAWAKAEVE